MYAAAIKSGAQVFVRMPTGMVPTELGMIYIEQARVAIKAMEDAALRAAPLPAGCIGWLECRVIDEPHIQRTYDLFLGEVVAAWADPAVYSDGRWHFESGGDALRSLHYIAGGAFFSTGEAFDAKE